MRTADRSVLPGANDQPAPAETDMSTAPAPALPIGGESSVVPLHRIPEISVHAFCDTPEIQAALETVAADRRMARAHTAVHTGGIDAAVAHYGASPSPNLLIVESRAPIPVVHERLDALADVCHSNTKLLLIGHVNDVAFYRELLARGVGEYVVAPVAPLALIGSISKLYDGVANEVLGRTIAFVGAKGGAGSSTIAHNVASMLGRLYDRGVLLADLDHPFGSARLCFGLDENAAVSQALQEGARLDYVLLERVLAKCDRHLSVLTAPTNLDEACDHGPDAFEHMLDVAQRNVPFVVLDLPHVWMSWSRRMLLSVDEVAVCAQPDLVGLQNARNIMTQLMRLRPNDAPPRLILNQVGMPRRAEISPGKFGEALKAPPMACIPFDPVTFSAAANKGKMIADIAPKSATAKAITTISRLLSGNATETTARRRLPLLGRLWGKR